MRLFHGTDSKIDSFSDEFVGHGNDEHGPGIYFINDIEGAAYYGKYIYEIEYTPNGRLLSRVKQADPRQLSMLIRKAPEWDEIARQWNSSSPEKGISTYLRAIQEYDEQEAFEQVWYDFFRHNPVIYVRNMVRLGYDGCKEKLNGSTIFVLFNPDTIKIKNVIDTRNVVLEAARLKLRETADKSDWVQVAIDRLKKFTDEATATEIYHNNAERFEWIYDNVDEVDIDLEIFGLANSLMNTDKKKLDEMKMIKVIATDKEEILYKLMIAIKNTGNCGHSFDIIVDPDLGKADGGSIEFFWDGDGSDKISAVNSKALDDNRVEITIEARDEDDTLVKMLEKIKEIGNGGHSFSIAVDPLAEGDNNPNHTNGPLFGWDGDGGSKIESIELSNEEKNLMENKDTKTNDKNIAPFDTVEPYPSIETIATEETEYDIEAEVGETGEAFDDVKERLDEAAKVNLKLTSNTKRELIKKAKAALDNLYAIYDTCERLGLDNKKFTKDLDKAFEGTNEMLTSLVCQTTIEKK